MSVVGGVPNQGRLHLNLSRQQRLGDLYLFLIQCQLLAWQGLVQFAVDSSWIMLGTATKIRRDHRTRERYENVSKISNKVKKAFAISIP